MKRVVTNYKFLKNCTKRTLTELSKKILKANEEEVKTLVECVANCSEDSKVKELVTELQNCRNFKDIRQLLLKNRRIVKSCIAIILSEILCCALSEFKGEDNATDDESNSN